MHKQFLSEPSYDAFNHVLVITIPEYSTIEEQKALLNACNIAQIFNARLIDESTATVHNYARDHLKDLKRQASDSIVAFIDIGHSKTTVTVAKFMSCEQNDQVEGEILIHNSDRNLGGRDLDY